MARQTVPPRPSEAARVATISVAIVHPEKLVRESLAGWVGADDRTEVVLASDDITHLEQFGPPYPSVLLSAVTPAFRPALEAFRAARPETTLVAVSAPGDGHLDAAIACGATGWITSSAGAREVTAAVVAAAHGWLVLPVDAYRSTLRCMAAARTQIAVLSDEEFELLAGLADGRTIAELAEKLYVSPRTVKRRVAGLRKELGCTTRAELVALFGQAMFPASARDS